MKNYKKVGIALLAVAALVFGMVLAGCSAVYEGDSTSGSAGVKAVKLTLSDTKYKIEYDGKTAEGNCDMTEVLGIKTYIGTSAPDYFLAGVDDGKVYTFGFAKGGMASGEWYVYGGELAKKSADGAHVVSLEDVELIIIEE